MRNMILRRRIGLFGSYFERYAGDFLPTAAAVVCYCAGYGVTLALYGCGAFVSLFDKTDGLVAVFFTLSVRDCLIASFLFFLYFSISELLLGVTLFGFVWIAFLLFQFGAVSALVIAGAFSVFDGRGVLRSMMTVLPSVSWFGAALILSCGQAAVLSLGMNQCVLRGQSFSKLQLKRFCKHQIVLFASAAAVTVWTVLSTRLFVFVR